VAGVVCFLLYVPTDSWWYVALGILLMLGATAASVTAIRKGEK
jgi:FtsH-binding integral membrane protein